jgi:hypothetical protein
MPFREGNARRPGHWQQDREHEGRESRFGGRGGQFFGDRGRGGFVGGEGVSMVMVRAAV